MNNKAIGQLAWHSRRGMRELDLLLVPFVRDHYSQLSEQEKQVYEQLLNCEDQDLWVWLSGRDKSPDASLQAMVEKILLLKPKQLYDS